MPPVIGISMRQIPAERIRPGLAAFEGRSAMAITMDYIDFVHRSGGSPILLPEGLEPEDAVEVIDGLLIPGGEDVDPRWYGHAPEDGEDLDMTRDIREFRLVHAAIEKGIPMLGICRGAQLINVSLGGSLADAPLDQVPHSSWNQSLELIVHDVEVRGARVVPDGIYAVNSAHHQMITIPGDGTEVVAHAPDGVPEAITCRDRGILGVQWHPECLESSVTGDWLVDQAAARKRRRSRG